jgi:hypothetical protein
VTLRSTIFAKTSIISFSGIGTIKAIKITGGNYMTHISSDSYRAIAGLMSLSIEKIKHYHKGTLEETEAPNSLRQQAQPLI